MILSSIPASGLAGGAKIQTGSYSGKRVETDYWWTDTSTGTHGGSSLITEIPINFQPKILHIWENISTKSSGSGYVYSYPLCATYYDSSHIMHYYYITNESGEITPVISLNPQLDRSWGDGNSTAQVYYDTSSKTLKIPLRYGYLTMGGFPCFENSKAFGLSMDKSGVIYNYVAIG